MARRKRPKKILVAEYPIFALRLEPLLRARLEATSVILGVSGNRYVTQAVEEALRTLPARQRKQINALAETIVSRYEPKKGGS